MSKYEEFQEWLNQCPTQIENYQDNGDHAIIRFDMPLDEDAENVEQCIIEGNDYKDCDDRMVETMTEYDKWGNIKR